MSEEWTDELLSDAREVVFGLLAQPMDDLAALAREVVAYRAHVHRVARSATDLELLDALATANLDLLERSAAAPPDHRRLASVAARYFANREGDDLSSPFGFDDDLEVFNAVAARVAPELVFPG